MKKIRKKIRQTLNKWLGYHPVTIDGMPFKVDSHHMSFWGGVHSGRWEPETFAILSKFIKPSDICCDIGSWIGPTVIYTARKCRKVVCFEPDPIAYRYLRENIALNELQNVTSYSVALSDGTAIRKMASFGGKLGDSMTSLLEGDRGGKEINVLALEWSFFEKLYQDESFDFIKIDIEGGEFSLIPAMKDYLTKNKPVLYLATHAPFLDPAERLEQMRKIVETLGIYQTCLDHRMRPVDISELTGEKALNDFHSYVFFDSPAWPGGASPNPSENPG